MTTEQPVPTDQVSLLVKQAARAIAAGLGDNFADAFPNKGRWIAKRGIRGGRFRDINEPMQHDYLEAAQKAAAIILEAAAKVAESDSLILSESRSGGSFGKTRQDHGELIASHIRALATINKEPSDG